MSVFRANVNAVKTGVNLQYKTRKASTAIVENTLLTLDANGLLIPAVGASSFIVGLAVGRVTANDADYTDAAQYGYDEPQEGERFIMDVDDAATGGFVAGVSRALVSAGVIKAGAVGAGGDVATVYVHKVLADTDQAEVSIISMTNRA